MPKKQAKQRSLPEERNDAMLLETDPALLASKCRVQDVKFNKGDDEPPHTETFVRIKTMRPGFDTPHFIMRKAADDYISATSMFRAVFHRAQNAEERHEMEVVQRELAARDDPYASGVWIPARDALKLAEIYGIRPWIAALLGASNVKGTTTGTPSSSRGTTGLPDLMPPAEPIIPHIPPPTTTTKRAKSPARKELESKLPADGVASELSLARAQVEAAQRKDAEALKAVAASSTQQLPTTASKPRRKRTRAEVDDEAATDGEATIPVKRARVAELELAVVQERRKVRALVGLVLGLGATAILPYVL